MLREWPGNVRELRNVAERFVITGMLSDDLDENETIITEGGFTSPDNMNLPERVSAYEKHLIEEEFKKNGGGVEQTYSGLGIPRKTLYDKIKKYSINRKLFIE
jgi:two-component system, NtrC family, C4-dicarboxylate transport response regulator DctD